METNKQLQEITNTIPLFNSKIAGICKKYHVTEAQLITEMLRYLNLVAQSNQPLSPSIIVDAAWHELILFTRFYAQFCEKYFSRFVHHTPNKKEDSKGFVKTIKYYILTYGKPNEIIWGDVALKEWESSHCGACHS
jgi:hypothetical protein